MKQKIHYLFMLLLMLLTGVGGVKAEEIKGQILFGTDNVKINAASVTANDNKSNSWTITTVGTTSFTQKGAYSQVGSSKDAATSITFTTTLSENVKVTFLKGRFGGFSGTAGTVTLKVDDTTVGTGSLNATEDVDVTTPSDFTGVEGKTLTITVTGISKGVKCYQLNYTYETLGGPSLTPAGLAFAEDSYTATLGESFTAPTLTNPNSLTVTYASSDENVATVDADGSVTLVGAGTTTITASSEATAEYAAGSASYTLTVVDPNAPGTQNNPYTVAQALDADPVNGVYVTGIVSSVVSTSVNNGQIRYYISDDGTENGYKLNVYNGKGLNNKDFTSIEDIQVGDVVVIYGNLSKYQNANQLAAGNYLISQTRKPVPTLSFGEEAYSVVKNGSLTITAETNSDGTISYESSDTDVAEIDASTGVVTAKAAGTTTITATVAATDTYKAATATVELTVTAPKHKATFYQNGEKLSEAEFTEDATIEFPEATATIFGKQFVGWTTSEITESTNTKPTLVTSATMGTANVNYYAVYANQEGENTLSTATLTANDNWSGYLDKTIIDDKGNNWTGVIAGQKSNGVFHYGLTKPDDKKDPHLTSPLFDYDITDVKIVATNGSSKERSFLLKDGESEVGTITVNANTSDVELTASLNDIPFKQFTLTASDALQFKSISVTYGTPATYSDYCTTVKEQATIRLYLPNNPEGNLTEHQLSCGAAVILNVYTNSPGAITIQDMTDGITVKPNTDNKTVTLLASTNNGKVFSQPGEYTFRVVVGETDSYTSASVDFKLKVVKFKAYFNNLTGFEETKDLANGTNGGQLKDQLISNTQWGDASYKTWTSTNEDVATIDNDGNITLIRTGQVRFIHSYTGNDYNEPCKISTGVMTVIDTTPTVLPTAPIIFHDGGDGVEYEGTLTVAMAGEGTIMYKLGADGEATAYTAPITINATTTVTAWAEKDGVKSDEVSKTFTIVEKQAGAEVADGYYNIKTSDGKYVNVAGRKTVTLASDAKSAGTVIRVSADANGVKVLRSQGVDVPGYAKKAMNYVPEIVQLAVDKLHAEGSGEILGEHGLDAIMEEFNKSFDYNLYLEKSGDAYRIYGRTPSMKPVVDFYAKNKANVDAKLPQLEAFINSAIDKVLDKTGGRGASILVDFKLHDVWQKMSGTLTEPTDEASTLKFYEEVLSSETNVWNFAYQTAMIYWGNLKYNDTFKKYIGKLGDYAKYIDKVENIRPNFKYYIVPSGSGVDFISEGNEAIINNNASAAWTMQAVTTFQVELPTEKNVTVYPTSGGTQKTYKEFYTTLYTDFAYTLPEGVKAYKVTAITDQGVAKREEITGTIPAQTPVLLVGESNTATLTLSTEAGTAITGNLLVGPDALINEYQIKTPQVVSLFEFAKEILGESAYKAYVEKYEHLMLKNAGTVNNKYFFGLTEDDLGDVTNLRILGMGYENELGFHDIWEKIDANKAFILTNDYDPVKLFLVGDVNRDGAVSIADVTALVNIILGKAKYPEDNDKYDFEAANVNGDKTISIADVTALVNIILGK